MRDKDEKEAVIKRMYQLFYTVLILLYLMASHSLKAMELPISLQVVLINKIIPFETSLSMVDNVSVLVVDEPDVFQAFKLLKVKQSESKIGRLEYATSLPKERFDIVYVNKKAYMAAAKIYALRHEALIVSGIPSNAKKSVSLGLGTHQGKPKFYINTELSEASGLSWHQKILQLATLY